MGVIFDEKSCGIIVYRLHQEMRFYLLLNYPGGHWDLPKGHVEKGENEQQTAARELLEETGIADIAFVTDFREEISYEYYTREKKLSRKQVVFFLARTEAKNIRLSHEHHDALWLPYDEAIKKLTFDNARRVVQKAQAHLGFSDKTF